MLQAGLSRETVAYDIIKSPEGLTRIITAAYQNLLHRTPDPGELPPWIVEMQNGMSSTQLQAAFARSAEFIADEGGIDPVARSPIDQAATLGLPLYILPPEVQFLQAEEEVRNIERIALGPAPIVFLGDSIFYSFAALSGQPVWNTLFAPLGAVDLGVVGFTTSDVLGQVNSGQVAALAPQVVVLMIGTNDLALGVSPQATAEAIGKIVDSIQASSPQTRILLLGDLPRGFSPADPFRPLVAQLNAQLASLADGRRVSYLDIGGFFELPNGILSSAIQSDGLHPSLAGYQILSLAIRPTLFALLGEQGPL